MQPETPPPEGPFVTGGLIEVYGRHEAAGSWLFSGWIAAAALRATVATVTAVCADASMSGEGFLATYPRGDLPAGDVGFVVLLPHDQRRAGPLLRLDIADALGRTRITPADEVRELPGRSLVEHGDRIVAACHDGDGLPRIRRLIARTFVGEGFVDAYGYHAPSAGWLICGWVSTNWIEHREEAAPVEATALFEGAPVAGAMILNTYARDDLAGRGRGFILHLAHPGSDLGRLVSVRLRVGQAVVVVVPSASASAIPIESTPASFAGLIAGSDGGPARDRLSALVGNGESQPAQAAQEVLVEFDEVVRCPPDGLILIGWILAHAGGIRTMRLRSGADVAAIALAKDCLWLDRPDVIEAVGDQHGFDDPRCGVVLRVATPFRLADDLVLEIVTGSGALVRKSLPPQRLSGLSAIKRILTSIELHYADVDHVFDHVLGPAIGALNARRLRDGPRLRILQFGVPVAKPRHSVIVPLYGRVDFMELQIALFATLGLGDDVDLIYLLDDPPRAPEAQRLAASLEARFRLPFRLICLSHNVGFAPANNIGLREARGEFVCFMNSDVFPIGGDWLPRLAAHLERDPRLGVIAPLLVFEDGSVQHQGLYFKPLPLFGRWLFPHHLRKGLRRPAADGLAYPDAITGAMMMLRRQTATALGGFDEAFVIGDFEDTDLCFKLAAKGQRCAVDLGLAMHHLERKSQAGSAILWRTNLTIYNAWIHQRRWSAAIETRLPPS